MAQNIMYVYICNSNIVGLSWLISAVVYPRLICIKGFTTVFFFFNIECCSINRKVEVDTKDVIWCPYVIKSLLLSLFAVELGP